MNDIVVYGATGFVGALTAEHLARHAPDGTRIALAGRSGEKLEKLRGRLGVDWPVIVADATDEAALAGLAASTRVVLTAAGPYAKYGRALVRACAQAGTHYADLTGEVVFVRTVIDEDDELARSTGARIVPSCGFDSIPSDLGVHLLYERVRADGEGELLDTTLVVTAMRGGLSGGTIDSLRTVTDELRRRPDLRKMALSPYSLSPDPAREPEVGRRSDFATVPGPSVDPSLRGTLAPFPMAPYNTRVVRRSNALRDWAYGRRFRYREAMAVGGSALGSPIAAAGVVAGAGLMAAGLALPPTRFLLDKVLPKPGSGPSEKTRRTGHFTVDLFTTTTTGARYTARIKAKGDPGYAATAVMLGESALALAIDSDGLPPSAGGVLTPATAMGDALVTRLRAAGMELSARRTG